MNGTRANRVHFIPPGDGVKRFDDHTNRLFKKHGMDLIGYWTPVDKDDTLFYMLAYPSLEHRKIAWDAFRVDPEWQKAFKDSHVTAGGKIVKKVDSFFVKPTDYSKIK